MIEKRLNLNKHTNMNKTTADKKTRNGRRAHKDLKITLTFTAEEWMTLYMDFEAARAFHESTADAEMHREEYTWAEHTGCLRERLVWMARLSNERRAIRKEVERARAAGFNIPDRALSLA